MPFYGKIKRTYSKKGKIPAMSNGLSFLDEHGKENQNHINRNSSLEESFWKDSFDKLLDDKQILREKKVIKKRINASYNRDSSKERDSFGLPDLFPPKRGKRGQNKRLNPNQNTKNSRPPKSGTCKQTRKRKKASHNFIGDAVISTPVGGKKAKQTNNLSFNVSPIGVEQPTNRFADISLSKSQSNDVLRSQMVLKRDVHARKFFNPDMFWSPVKMGRRVDLNLDHDSVKGLIKSFVRAVNASNEALTGRSIIEISDTDDEVLDEVLKKTNPETLIRLALLPRSYVVDTLEQSMKKETLHEDIVCNKSSKGSNSLAFPPIPHVTHRKSKKGSLLEQNLTRSITLTTSDTREIEQLSTNKSVQISNQSPQYVTHRKTRSKALEKHLEDNKDESEILDRNQISSVFYGFNDTELNFGTSLLHGKDLEATNVDSVRKSDICVDVTTSIGLEPKEDVEPDRISINYLNKTLQIVEEEFEESIAMILRQSTIASSPNTVKSLEPIHIEDSPICSRNDVTQGVFQVPYNSPVCNKLTPLLPKTSERKTFYEDNVSTEIDIPYISVIPATPTVTRRSRRKIVTTSNTSSNTTQAIPLDNLSVIDCTFSEMASQRRVTRRMTKKNVKFSDPSTSPLEVKDAKVNQRKRKTVAFQVPRVETFEQPSFSIHLASGKWRKSLAAWKRQTLALSENTISNETVKNQTRLSKADISTKKISGIRKSDGRWLSSISQKAIQEENDEDEELVLEPTTDETCNLSELSLRDSEADSHQEEKTTILCLQNNNAALQRSHSYIDESRHHRSLYRRQLSTRARKTSVYERTFVPTSPYYSHPANDLLLILPKLTARDVVLRLCKQSEPLPFDAIYSAQALRCCRKIGEGVYSEVFMYKSQGRTIVLKVIPVEGDQLVNGEPQKHFEEIQSEIVIAQELTDLRYGDKCMTDGFVEAVNVRCVEGRYPDHLIELWELYDENRTSDNDHPELFKDNQLFIVLELANAGQDLEAFQFDNAQQSHSAFLQVAITLAIAEKRLEFEHRDLHWGNILLSNTDESHVIFKIDGKSIEVPTHGVKATIIDFTLSRMVANGVRFYNDLAQDDELFSASGDYQFDIYRFMKTRLDNCWERFEPYTNLLWLHYLIDKMINGARYKSSKSKKHRAAVDQLMQLRDELLDYKSAADYVECIYI